MNYEHIVAVVMYSEYEYDCVPGTSGILSSCAKRLAVNKKNVEIMVIPQLCKCLFRARRL